ncbi:hypothetical protein G6F65_022090 [Rhizopus arrhizus]|nr:hypothetical protein G6F65_022090 [Rhizopus arrhizus]
MSLVEQRVPASRLTEGMTWLLAGLNIGVALGAALSGYSVDAGGVRSGFVIALVAGAVVLLVALLAWRALRRPVPSLCAEGVVP